MYRSSENQQFYDAITHPDWMQNIAHIYENDVGFSDNLDALFRHLQIPNQHDVAAVPLPENLFLRLIALRQTGFAVVQQNHNAFVSLNALRLVSEGMGYYAPAQNRIIPRTVSPDSSPDRSGLGGQNPDGRDGAGGPGVAI
jgi:hypothetical protein